MAKENTQPTPEEQKKPETVATAPAVDPQVTANIATPRDETAKRASDVLDKQEPPELPDGLIFNPESAKKRYEEFVKAKVDIHAVPFGEFDALRMVSENPQPMSATEALKTLKKCVGFDASEEQIRKRFQRLDGFGGQVYMHATDRNHKTYVYVTGVENGKIAFTLECNIFNRNGIAPIARIDEQDPPNLPKKLRDELIRGRRDTKESYEYSSRYHRQSPEKIYQLKVLEMLVKNPRPMKAEEALKVLTDNLGQYGQSEKDMMKNFPDFNEFKGEIYMSGKTHASGDISFHIIGVENGEIKFRLEYDVSERNGIAPTRRNGVKISGNSMFPTARY